LSARLFLLLTLAAFAQDKPATDPPKGSIAGTVTESVSGAPMKDVEIWINRNSPQAVHAVTDQSGHYVVRDVTPGSVRVSASAPDSSGRTGFGPTASRQISLAPGQDLAGVDFRLVLAGQISGKVLDQNKEPVVGVSVFLVVREYTYGALRIAWNACSPDAPTQCWPPNAGAPFRRFRSRPPIRPCGCRPWCRPTIPIRRPSTAPKCWCCVPASGGKASTSA
jgi:hypothetical protein